MPLRPLNSLLIPEVTAPTAAPTGHVHVYAKSDGLLYFKDDGGTERLTGPPIEAFVFSIDNTQGTSAIAAPVTGKARLPAATAYVFVSAQITLSANVAGTALTVDINKNGTTLYTTQSARPSIGVGAAIASGNSPAVTAIAADDYLTVDLDAGSVPAGEVLTVVVRARRTA